MTYFRIIFRSGTKNIVIQQTKNNQRTEIGLNTVDSITLKHFKKIINAVLSQYKFKHSTYALVNDEFMAMKPKLTKKVQELSREYKIHYPEYFI